MAELRSSYGKVLGPVGKSTRTALLRAVEECVNNGTWRRVTVAEVTAFAECSTALFYQYWRGDYPFEMAVKEVIKNKMSQLAPGEELPERWAAVKKLMQTEGWRF